MTRISHIWISPILCSLLAMRPSPCATKSRGVVCEPENLFFHFCIHSQPCVQSSCQRHIPPAIQPATIRDSHTCDHYLVQAVTNGLQKVNSNACNHHLIKQSEFRNMVGNIAFQLANQDTDLLHKQFVLHAHRSNQPSTHLIAVLIKIFHCSSSHTSECIGNCPTNKSSTPLQHFQKISQK